VHMFLDRGGKVGELLLDSLAEASAGICWPA
jgi:hypothetical protein